MDDKKVAELLTRALTAVDAAKVPDDLREVAFTTALTLLGGGAAQQSGNGAGAVSAPPVTPVPQTTATTGSGESTGSPVLDAIATELGLDPNVVRRIYADKDGAPELILKSSKLPGSKSAAAPDIALLVMAGRQAAGLDDYTEAETLRAACRRYGKFDQGNFGKHMRSLDNLILTQGKGASAKRKLTHPGIEAAGELIEKYAAEE